ncbi:protein PHLOEM PROTEIN 2-LIKE A10-like [Phoenix dactylifera]|uniref:Protein PHLOEM PROTEIN 2-LIKE A10-like n=1 Tax=Phoenix dactylifera TaxID=42345 RepID=A0A8B8ZIU1_PHODC|nr:protein PHLOEM PROTEIN 2-LIKE A10-like [Phoenix dactylifera]
MDILEFSRRRRRWLLLAATAGISGYGAYKLYHLPSVARKRRKLARLFGTLVAVADAASSSAETVALVSSDLSRFLRSDSDEIPTSLKQISKIARSEEFSGSLSRVSEVLTIGILRGFQSSSVPTEPESVSVSSSSFSDRFLDKLFSTAGSGFASVVAGSFARSLVMAFSSTGSDGREVGSSQSDSPAVPRWVHLICSDKCRELIGDCIQLFVSTAVAVYLDKTMDINPYDEIFSGLTNPKHEAKAKDMLTSVCNGAVETLIKTSHQVLIRSNSSSSVNRIPGIEQEEDLTTENDRKTSFHHKSKDASVWFHEVSSTLAVPSNRRFVLDVMGRITFETVRSSLDFVLWRMRNDARIGVNAVCDEVADRGSEVLRYISAKSLVIVTICLALCLHVLASTRDLMPA